MAITLNISTDYLIFDNYETVSLTSYAGVTTSSLRGLKETLAQREVSQGGMITDEIKCRWHLFVAQLGGAIPQQHGYITDANGTKHYIDDVPELASWDTRYTMTTTAQAAATLRGSHSY